MDKINIKGECSRTCIKNKIKNAITAHSKLLTLGIGLAITFAISIAIGMVDHQEALARVRCRYC